MIKKIIGGLLIVVVILGISGIVIARHYLGKINPTPSPKVQGQKEAPKSEPSQPYFTKPINILVLGADERANDKGRSDTIMVYHVDPINNKVALLSVPRDTYVNISGRGMDKVNHAYAFGGIDLSKRTLEEFLGIKIDYYMQTNFAGFTSFIDTLGGITVNVEKDIQGTDIKQGVQKLDGVRALAYVRDRKDPMGDIARVRRQQRFMKAMALETANYEPKWKLVLEIPIVYKNVKTDMPLDGALALNNLVQKLDIENAQIEEIPGWFYNYKGISYWKPDKAKTDLIVQQIFTNQPGTADANVNTANTQ